MEKLNFGIIFADNGVIIKDMNDNMLSVYQEKKQEKEARQYLDRALYDSILTCIRDMMLGGTKNLDAKDKYKIRIEIR